MCGVRDIWVLAYVCHYKTFHSFRPQDGYFSSIFILFKCYKSVEKCGVADVTCKKIFCSQYVLLVCLELIV